MYYLLYFINTCDDREACVLEPCEVCGEKVRPDDDLGATDLHDIEYEKMERLEEEPSFGHDTDYGFLCDDCLQKT